MDLCEIDGFRFLTKALLSLESEAECAAFLEDLLTRKELTDIAQRLLVAKMLSEQIVYNKIVEQTGASTATISRVNRCLIYGSGGYRLALDKAPKKEETP